MDKIDNESGVVLIAALVVMVLLILLGTSGIMTSTTEIRIGKNYNSSVDSFYFAEGGRASGEDWIINTVGSGAPNTTFASYGIGLYDSQAGDLNLNTLKWDATDSMLSSTGQAFNYLVEYLGSRTVPNTANTGGSLGIGGGHSAPETRYLYRSSGRGTSVKGISTVQSTYAIR